MIYANQNKSLLGYCSLCNKT